jgi:three-Cys-motif partner protein
MPKIDVKKHLLDHSEIKVQLLGRYLKRFLPIIANLDYNERIRIYDLFCGEGVYENGGEGSPLVILQAIKKLKESGVVRRPLPPIDRQFNDKVEYKVLKTKKAAEEKGLIDESSGKTVFTVNDYQEEVKILIELFSKLKKEKAFVFIDPYGYKHIKASDIRDLLKAKNAEVLLFLPTQFMYRFDQSGTPEALKDFIEELVEYQDWKETDSVWKFIDQLKTSFRNYLGNDYFVDTFTIQKDANTVFCLFFFSSHIRGFEKMLEAKWEIDTEQGKGWQYDIGGPSLFFAQRTNALEEKLKKFFEKPKSNGQIYEFTLHCGFLPSHCTEVLNNLQKKEELSTKRSDGQKTRKGAFYISYEHYKSDFNKILITKV